MSRSRCERCGRPCGAAMIFCDECRALLQEQYQTMKLVEVGQDGEQQASVALSQPVGMPSWQGDEGESMGGASIFERITSPLPSVQAPERERERETPLPPILEQDQVQETYSLVEQALNRLNEAARRIAKVEGSSRRHPHASRLTPLRDISAEIQRESTPLPKVSAKEDTQQQAEQGQRVPDLWPWLQDSDAEESENDIWDNRPDTMLHRRFPNSAESARIEEEDMRRAIADGWITRP